MTYGDMWDEMHLPLYGPEYEVGLENPEGTFNVVLRTSNLDEALTHSTRLPNSLMRTTMVRRKP